MWCMRDHSGVVFGAACRERALAEEMRRDERMWRIRPGVPAATARGSTCGAGMPSSPSLGKSRMLTRGSPSLSLPSRLPPPCRDFPREYPPLPTPAPPSSPCPWPHTHSLPLHPEPIYASLTSTQQLSPSCSGGNARGGIVPKWPRGGDNVQGVDDTETHHHSGDEEKI